MEVSDRETPTVVAGREALADHRWTEAFDLMSEADRTGSLDPEDLLAFAEAAWFEGNADLAIELKERAYKAYAERERPAAAAIVAFDLAREYAYKRKMSIASAWAARGERLVRDEPESPAHGYLALTQAGGAREAGEVEQAIGLAERAVDIGSRFGDTDLQAFGLIVQGSLLIGAGRTDDGFPMLEEATVAAVNGEIHPFTAGVAYCQMISSCRDTTDYRRAGEWAEAAHRWCERQAINGFPGICRVHSAEITALQGALGRAEQELERATKELANYNATPPLADGFYALGEIRFKLGDVDGAREALREAHALGRSPEPALALIRLSEGQSQAALTAINAAVAEQTADVWARARLLAAQVEIAVGAGDARTARAAADELADFTASHDSPVLHSATHEAQGRALLAEGDAEAASAELRTAIRHWQEVGAPYELAKARAALAAALERLGQDDGSRLEREAAREGFERLGAVRDAAAASDALRAADERRAGPVKIRKTFVFTDIVGSTVLAEAMGDEAWEHLLRWHDDTLRELFGKHGGEVVTSTGDGFFVAFDRASDAIDSAVGAQRALAEHRRTHGFAPGVRIGVHAAEANRRGEDYSGMGVHVAARIAALAEGGEVLVSAETLAGDGGRYRTSDPKPVALKGVADEVDVVSVSVD